MGLRDLLCVGRPRLDDSDYQPLGGTPSNESFSEKKVEVAADEEDEDEMQTRLSDLRKAISDAKVDW